MQKPTGYTDCQCRDCFDVAIYSDDGSHFCLLCQDAGCDEDSECQRDDAYGCDMEDGVLANQGRTYTCTGRAWRYTKPGYSFAVWEDQDGERYMRRQNDGTFHHVPQETES